MKILVHIQWPVKAWSIPDAHAEALARRFPEHEFVRVRNIEDAARAVHDADISFSPRMTAEMITSAKQLRWVHSSAAAVEGLLPLAELAERGIILTNSKGIQAVPIAEHVMGGILMLSRRFDRMLDAQRSRTWIQNDLTLEWPWLLHGQRMTIVGLGTIGIEVARRAHAFGIHVTGVRRDIAQPLSAFVDQQFSVDQLDDALVDCDLLVLAAPGVSSTRRMVGAQQLALLKRGALLINVARANIVDDGAMREALQSGQLGGAVLDVFEQEPLSADDALWSMPHVIVTPHSSGFRSSHWDDVVALFAQNLDRYCRSDTLLNVVDLTHGY